MRIGIDAMGGDYAPEECINAILSAVNSYQDLYFTVFGEEKALNAFLKENHPNIQIVFCEDTIQMNEHPTKAVVSKKNSSINIGINFLKEDKIDVFASAGNTGAVMVSSMYQLNLIAGLERPALCSLIPKRSGGTGVLLDVGANADLKPESLANFAVLGSEYAKAVYNIDNPKVGLLNIGEEKEKGNILTKAAFGLLESKSNINFIGNIEGRHIFEDKADVVVCDGFTGNVVVKTCEGMFYNLLKNGVQDEFLDRFNFEHYGGSPILGIDKPVIVAHGISKKNAFLNTIKLAQNMVDSKLISNIDQSFEVTSNN